MRAAIFNRSGRCWRRADEAGLEQVRLKLVPVAIAGKTWTWPAQEPIPCSFVRIHKRDVRSAMTVSVSDRPLNASDIVALVGNSRGSPGEARLF